MTLIAEGATYATVLSENCTLHYWYISNPTKPLLIFIPGGNGHGRQFNSLLTSPHLTSNFTTCTFDRRQMSASLSTHPSPWNPTQQARDIIAIMSSLSYATASIFASSGGGVNALQLAASYPHVLKNEMVILHEPPLSSLLPAPENAELMDFLFDCVSLYQSEGIEKAMEKFNECMIGMDDGIPMLSPPAHNPINQYEYEMPWMGIYCPDLERVKENGIKVVVAYGVKSGEASYVRSGKVLAERLGCERVCFPGHHQGFQTEWEEFAVVLRGVLEGSGGERK